MRKINLIVIHCSATDIPHNIHDINQWHLKRGFRRSEMSKDAFNKADMSIGYHFFIDKLGRIFKGRNEEEIGAHASGYNSNSIGICLEGSSLFTDIQFISAQALVSSLLIKYNLETQHVLPHNQLDKHGKTCPNFDINDKILSNIFKDTLTKE